MLFESCSSCFRAVLFYRLRCSGVVVVCWVRRLVRFLLWIMTGESVARANRIGRVAVGNSGMTG